ncbi:hypothetical protein ZWY2020_020165 [Hordeum vulgare]|nr:hypothetical protein ZWY2020_020165 [Hordeum vulgare]
MVNTYDSDAKPQRSRRTPPPLYSLYSGLYPTPRLPAQPAVRPSRRQVLEHAAAAHTPPYTPPPLPKPSTATPLSAADHTVQSCTPPTLPTT